MKIVYEDRFSVQKTDFCGLFTEHPDVPYIYDCIHLDVHITHITRSPTQNQ